MELHPTSCTVRAQRANGKLSHSGFGLPVCSTDVQRELRGKKKKSFFSSSRSEIRTFSPSSCFLKVEKSAKRVVENEALLSTAHALSA